VITSQVLIAFSASAAAVFCLSAWSTRRFGNKKAGTRSAVVCITCALGVRLMCAGAASAVIVNISQHKFI